MIKTQGKRLEALGDVQSLKYENGAHECEASQKSDNVDNGECIVLISTEKCLNYKMNRIENMKLPCGKD